MLATECVAIESSAIGIRTIVKYKKAVDEFIETSSY